MTIIDLTRPFSNEPLYRLDSADVPLVSDATRYTGVIYQLHLDSMCSTYIDLPGHIHETDNGLTAENVPPERFFRMPAHIVHLSRQSGSGAVMGAELEAGHEGLKTECLVVNALGKLNATDIAERTVWLDNSAIDWILSTGCRVLISDIYESQRLEGVFLKLFKAGVSTVCLPVNLFKLNDIAKITVLFCPVPNMTQIPCRVLAEVTK
ncbi:MAG: cyclase family protein [Victivallales bacterium]|nr:cyclase family protein [Victivallales bacterium]